MIQSFYDLNLPYSTPDLPGIGGQLRATPEHFVVEEIPLYEPRGEGQHLYVQLTKVGLTTTEVQRQLERLFHLKRGDVGFAGMKDKQARTTQVFSLNVGYREAGFVVEAVRQIAEQLPVIVHWAKFHGNKLKPGHLLGNRFAIIITEIGCPPAEAMERAEAIAGRLKAHGAPNYFGPQRFGVGGDNVRQGLEILLGQRQQPDRWLRRFLISSYQSYLCNRYLARRMEMGAFDHLLNGDIAKKHATGGMFEVQDMSVEQPRYAAQEISFTASIYGPKMWEATGPAGQLESAILAEGGITMEQLQAARVEGTRRLGRVLASDLKIHPAAEGISVEFSLPKGAFATTALRELMKVDLEQAPEVDDEE